MKAYKEMLAKAGTGMPEAHMECLSHGAGHKTIEVLLRTFVREWSEEGLAERGSCHEKILGALATFFEGAGTGDAAPRVLVVDSKLGRLPWEIQRRGFRCDSCEAKTLQYFGQELIRAQFREVNGHVIQPFAVNTCNRRASKDNTREVRMPEVAVEEGSLPPNELGHFVRLFGGASSLASRDALVTSFAFEPTTNPLRFLRTVAHVVRPGGAWVNFGPMSYDDDDESRGCGVELSWEELRTAMLHFFEVKEECVVNAMHAVNARSLMQVEYKCVFFVAVRNQHPASGIGGTP